MHKSIFADWRANHGNSKGRLIMILFRIASRAASTPRPIIYATYPYVVFYRFFVEWVLGVELPWRLNVGTGLRLYHGQALVVNDRCVIGENCILRHSTTIGVAYTADDFGGAAPTIGDNVDIGAHVVIIGDVTIGSGASIAAGSVVVHDVPVNAVVVGNPAKVIKIRQRVDDVE